MTKKSKQFSAFSISWLLLIIDIMSMMVGCGNPTQAPTFESNLPPTQIPLSPTGSWLAFTANKHLFAVNKDGTGLKTLVPELSVRGVKNSLSANIVVAITSETNTLSKEIILVELPGGRIIRKVSLLSFYANGQANLDYGPTGPLNGIGDIQWSPDGKYLAFTSAIDSPLSTLYIYNINHDVIKQLSQNNFQVARPIWSPDGAWIVYEEVRNFHGWQTEGVWAVSPHSGELKLMYKSPGIEQKILGWVGNSDFVVADRAMDGDRNIRIVEVATGNIKTLFSGYFSGASLDTKYGAVAFFFHNESPADDGFNLGQGIYLVSPEITVPKSIIPTVMPILIGWNSETEVFESQIPCKSNPEDIIIFNSSGEINCTQKPKPNSSPNSYWYITLGERISIFENSGKKAGEVPKNTNHIIWRSDSNGFFFISNNSLFYVSLPEINYFEVYRDNHNDFNYSNLKWIGIP